MFIINLVLHRCATPFTNYRGAMLFLASLCFLLPRVSAQKRATDRI